jgi:hypothetical protein
LGRDGIVTIAAALLCPEGVVLGTDSTTSHVMGENIVDVSNATQKLFQLGRDKPYAFATYGDAHFGSRSYRDLIWEFGRTLKDENPPLNQVAEEFLAFAKKRWAEQAEEGDAEGTPLPDTGFIIGGCGESDPNCSFATVHFHPEEDIGGEELSICEVPGEMHYAGIRIAADRLIYGMGKEVWFGGVGQFVPEERRKDCLDAVFGPSDFRMAPDPSMPLRDALDYVHFIIEATIKYCKFTLLPPICGGKIELACVTADRGFRWVTHKSLDWCIGDVESQTEYSPFDPHGHGR